MDIDEIRQNRRYCNECRDGELTERINLWSRTLETLPRSSDAAHDIKFLLRMYVEEQQARADLRRLQEARRLRQSRR